MKILLWGLIVKLCKLICIVVTLVGIFYTCTHMLTDAVVHINLGTSWFLAIAPTILWASLELIMSD